MTDTTVAGAASGGGVGSIAGMVELVVGGAVVVDAGSSDPGGRQGAGGPTGAAVVGGATGRLKGSSPTGPLKL